MAASRGFKGAGRGAGGLGGGPPALEAKYPTGAPGVAHVSPQVWHSQLFSLLSVCVLLTTISFKFSAEALPYMKAMIPGNVDNRYLSLKWRWAIKPSLSSLTRRRRG